MIVETLHVFIYYISWCYDSPSGMLSHQLKKNVIDGEKAIIQNPSENQR